MRQYLKYKNSNTVYLGEIPANWDLEKIKFQGKVVSGSTPETNKAEFWDGEIVWATPVDFGEDNQKYIYTSKRKITKAGLKDIGGKLVPIGSVVISSRAPIGLVAMAGVQLQTNQGCKSVIPKKVIGEYLYYCLKEFSTVLEKLGNETIFAELSMNTLKNFFIPIPPSNEQIQIVQYLDFKTDLIDEFNANRQKQIDLLKEQKAGIICKAVTKGIDPNAKMRPSGIYGINEIPEHWTTGKIRRVLNLLTDFTANGSFADLAKNVKYYDTVEYSRLIRLTDLRDGLKNDGIYVKKEAHEYLSKSELFGGEILMANVGAYAGLVCLVPELNHISTLGPNMFLLKFNEKRICKEYIFTLLGCDYYYKLLMNKALSSAQPKLNKEDVKSIDLIFPPSLEEQGKILEFIKNETANIEALISKYKKQIDLMKEYRTAIISKAVTGKIDVRNWQPKTKEAIS